MMKKPGVRSAVSGKSVPKEKPAPDKSSDDTSAIKKTAIEKPTPKPAQKKAAKPARKPLAVKIDLKEPASMPTPKLVHDGVQKSKGKVAWKSTRAKLIPAYYESSSDDDTSDEEIVSKKHFTKLVIEPARKSMRVRKGETGTKIRKE